MTADVLIAGAGPVGLTLAGELIRHGVTPRIVDKAPAPATTSRALVLWARTLELLDQAGTAAPALALGVRARGIRLYADRTLLAHVTVGDVDSPMPPGVLIPQNETERILHEHLVALGGGSIPRHFLYARSETIMGGTSEIQRNVIAQRILGLPR